MRYSEFAHLTEAPQNNDMGDLVKQQYGETTYGTWTIKYNKMPNKQGKYGANAFHVRNEPIKVVADTHEQAMAEVKRKIDFIQKANDTALKFSDAVLDFNVEFTRDVVSETGVTGIRLQGSGDGVFLVVCGAEYAEAFGNEVFGTGPDRFVKMFDRKVNKKIDGESAAGKLYGASVTPNQIKTLGLQPFGRYALDFEKEIEGYGHKVYRLVYDSTTQSSRDKVRLHKPGLTIAVF
jgi:hypothetical protein